MAICCSVVKELHVANIIKSTYSVMSNTNHFNVKEWTFFCDQGNTITPFFSLVCLDRWKSSTENIFCEQHQKTLGSWQYRGKGKKWGKCRPGRPGLRNQKASIRYIGIGQGWSSLSKSQSTKKSGQFPGAIYCRWIGKKHLPHPPKRKPISAQKKSEWKR